MIRLVLEEERTITSINKKYNLGEGTVQSWIRQFEEESEKDPGANEKGELYEKTVGSVKNWKEWKRKTAS